jgi:hypothetical protein
MHDLFDLLPESSFNKLALLFEQRRLLPSMNLPKREHDSLLDGINGKIWEKSSPLQQKLRKLQVLGANNVGVIVSWGHYPSVLHAGGINSIMPTISFFYPFGGEKWDINDAQLSAFKDSEVVAAHSPFALQQAVNYGFPKGKLLVVPPSSPEVSDHLVHQPESIRRFKRAGLIQSISGQMGKPNVPADQSKSVLFSCFDTSQMKNTVEVLRAFEGAAASMPNAYLMLKGGRFESFTTEERVEYEKLVGKFVWPKPELAEEYGRLSSGYSQTNMSERKLRDTRMAELEKSAQWIPGSLWDKPWFLYSRGRASYPAAFLHEFVSPSSVIVSVGGMEPGPHVISEASSLGIPSIVQRTGANPGLFGNSVYYVEPERKKLIKGSRGELLATCDAPDEKSLARAFQSLYANPGERLRLGKLALVNSRSNLSSKVFRNRLSTAITTAVASRYDPAGSVAWHRQRLEDIANHDLSKLRKRTEV